MAAQWRQQLRQAVRDCRDRGLTTSAKWASQQIAGLDGNDVSLSPAASAQAVTAEDDVYELARSMFDLKVSGKANSILGSDYGHNTHRLNWQEYHSAAHALRFATTPTAVFLRMYSRFLMTQKVRKDSKVEKETRERGCSSSIEDELGALEEELLSMKDKGFIDGFLLYLLGIILIDKNKLVEARHALALAVTTYPCNWAAWEALKVACADTSAITELSLPQHFAFDFFVASLAIDCHDHEEAFFALQKLSKAFKQSETVEFMVAKAQCNLQEFNKAQELFEDLLTKDPHRLEGMDLYSNCLYVKEEAAALSHLAHRCMITDKYSPLTCCVVGNYYSLKAQHERAITYFKRALKLDPHFLSAWTLMGHEYVELKNPSAAIEAYRKAVEVNSRDYRAWYGLGQTYELMDMPYYALYYFRRAVALRPTDARMWNAMGQCYQQESLGALDAAIRCHRRALPHDKEGVAVHELAKLHDRMGQRKMAAHYHDLNLKRLEAEGVAPGSDAVEALQYLADYARDIGEYEQAERMYARLLDYGAAGKEEAKASLREVRALRVKQGRSPKGSSPML